MRRALVTGGSRGIGAAITRSLAQLGHDVWVMYRENDEAAEKLRRELAGAPGVVHLLRCDVRDRARVRASLAPLLEAAPFSILVNNAGIASDAAFPAMTDEAWESVLATTLAGFYNVTQPLVMPMVRARFGRIVSVGSVSGVLGRRGQVNYSAAKAGLFGATKALAQEVARRGVTVNAVAPGFIETEMSASVPREEVLETIPARRFGTPEEVASVVRFLVSEEASYVTGQIIGVTGGLG